MSHESEKLDASALSRAGLDAVGLTDWRESDGHLHARFRTGDFAAGLALVNRIGEAAEEADHHPDLTLTYSEVEVALVSHDVGAVTRRDVELARTISTIAAEPGISPDHG